jgi:hypothetical protein
LSCREEGNIRAGRRGAGVGEEEAGQGEEGDGESKVKMMTRMIIKVPEEVLEEKKIGWKIMGFTSGKWIN